jgi:cytochrome P450
MRITAPDAAERVPLDGIDLYDPEGYRTGCRHAAWQTLRHEAPVWWHQRPGQVGFWSVADYADCERVLKDHRTFSSASGTVLGGVDPAGGRTISLMDPPDHTALRTDAMRSFSHGAVRARADRIRAEVTRLVQPCLDGEQDFAVLMRRLPMAVVGEVIGIPEEHWDAIAYWTAAGLAPRCPEFSDGSTPERVLRRAHHEIFARFGELIADRRRHSHDDLISRLLEVRVGGRRLDDDAVMLNCYSFMAGANSTTPHVASHTMLALIERPAMWAWLAEDPGRIPGTVEEGVRWAATPHHLARRATRDTTLGGVPVSAGDWVCAWLGSALRDEAVFDRPFEFDPHRRAVQNLGFGAGLHYCIGAPLSRHALRLLFEVMLARFAQVDLVGPVTHMTSNWINGIMSMPVLAKARP